MDVSLLSHDKPPLPSAGETPPAPGPAGDRYELGELLGQGGGGRVYRGLDRALGRQVAVKVLNSGEKTEQVARFEREVLLLARLQHPHLIPLYDAGLDRGRQYLVMPFIRGLTLAERIASGPMPEHEAARVGTALGRALAYIHVHGIVHRDVKPSNVLLGRDRRILLADFGIARGEAPDQTVTMPGQLTGTAAYLAPEQVEGGETGPSCDIYALGLVLLEALTGVRAFPGATLEQAMARLRRQPAIPRALGPRWGKLLSAMTDRDPVYRPDATAVTDYLDQVCGPAALTAVPADKPRSGNEHLLQNTLRLELASDPVRTGTRAHTVAA